jgi:hypothetical protein
MTPVVQTLEHEFIYCHNNFCSDGRLLIITHTKHPNSCELPERRHVKQTNAPLHVQGRSKSVQSFV